MVAPEEEEVLWVFDLVGEQQANAFYGLLAPINIIP